MPAYSHVSLNCAVTVTNVSSLFDDDLYHEDDVVTIDDHGLYGPWPEALRPYYFSYSFKQFMVSTYSISIM